MYAKKHTYFDQTEIVVIVCYSIEVRMDDLLEDGNFLLDTLVRKSVNAWSKNSICLKKLVKMD